MLKVYNLSLNFFIRKRQFSEYLFHEGLDRSNDLGSTGFKIKTSCHNVIIHSFSSSSPANTDIDFEYLNASKELAYVDRSNRPEKSMKHACDGRGHWSVESPGGWPKVTSQRTKEPELTPKL